MFIDQEQELTNSLHTGFIDAETPSRVALRPQLVRNDNSTGIRVLTTIQEELSSCTQFDLSIAFITKSGVISILETLKELKNNGIQGRILTTNYLNFSSPEALETLMDFPNIDIRVFEGNFHVKGYLFYHEKYCSLIVGSANLTDSALSLNQEWNLKVSSSQEGEIIKTTISAFQQMWDQSHILDEGWLTHYRLIYEAHKMSRIWVSTDPSEIEEPDRESTPFSEEVSIEPNKMQREALLSMKELRDQGERKALLISATGTGKTYLAALDVHQYKPKKFLYIVHRETILRSACESFQKIYGDKNLNTTIVSGNNTRDLDADFVFANISTLSKPDMLHHFKPDHFDYIVIDEAHRVGAPSYERIVSYFKPEFLLGMTATPERTDGKDIYEVFDHNIAYNIRLHQALKHELLCPFHYFGITELSIDSCEPSDNLQTFAHINSDEKTRQLKENIDFYSMHEKRRRGLIFCSRNDESCELSQKLNALGMRTLAISGKNSEAEREEAIARLESEHRSDHLEYIITVDIFNEGVDIPSLNQIIMVRPTQSAIIFVQQLGRGLRKFPNKHYLTVIDFIGNYENNFLIPVALYGDISFNKDRLRKLVASDSVPLPGVSTVQFDRIAKECIYRAIDDANTNKLPFLKERYRNLKVQIGGIPTLMDFAKAREFDAMNFITYSTTYRAFVDKVEKRSDTTLTPDHMASLLFLSIELASGIRPYELLILKRLIEKESITLMEIKNELHIVYGIFLDDPTIQSVIRILNGEFFQAATLKKYGNISYIHVENDSIIRSEEFSLLLQSQVYTRECLDILDFGLYNYETYNFEDSQENDLKLYNKYTRKDVCKLLHWDKDESSTIYGYKIKHNTCPIFVTYKKKIDVAASIDYRDEFIDQDWFSWMTRSRVRLTSKDPVLIMDQASSNLKISLFIKKSDDECKSHYYMGDVEYIPGLVEETTIKNDDNVVLPIVNFQFKLKQPVQGAIYRYLTSYHSSH